MACGAWAMISVAFFATEDKVVLVYGHRYESYYGCFLGVRGRQFEFFGCLSLFLYNRWCPLCFLTLEREADCCLVSTWWH